MLGKMGLLQTQRLNIYSHVSECICVLCTIPVSIILSYLLYFLMIKLWCHHPQLFYVHYNKKQKIKYKKTTFIDLPCLIRWAGTWSLELVETWSSSLQTAVGETPARPARAHTHTNVFKGQHEIYILKLGSVMLFRNTFSQSYSCHRGPIIFIPFSEFINVMTTLRIAGSFHPV